MPIFSSSPLAFGSIAKLITGLGKSSGAKSTGVSEPSSTSPVAVSFSLATAPMSPSPNSCACSWSFPWRISSWPTRSLFRVRELTSVESDESVPESTRKRLMRPANGSATVLKTNAAGPPPSTSTAIGFLAGDGMPSTSRSRRPVVPRFFVGTPQVTGKS